MTNQSDPDIEFEDTGEIAVGGSSMTAQESLLEELTNIVKLGDGNGGGEGAHQKAAKKQNRIILILMLIVGPGGAVGAHYALKGQAASNTQEVKHLNKSIHGTDKRPGLVDRVGQNEENIRLIEVHEASLDKSIKGIEASYKLVVGGIEDLKAESVNSLKKDLAKAEREVRRLERNQ